MLAVRSKIEVSHDRYSPYKLQQMFTSKRTREYLSQLYLYDLFRDDVKLNPLKQTFNMSVSVVFFYSKK